MHSALFQSSLPVHRCDMYIILPSNQTVSRRNIHFSAVGTFLIISFLFRKPRNHILLTKSHPSFKAQFTYSSFTYSHIFPDPANWLWYLSPLSCQSTLYVPLLWFLAYRAVCLVNSDLGFFPLVGSRRAGTMSSLFLKVNTPDFSRR